MVQAAPEFRWSSLTPPPRPWRPPAAVQTTLPRARHLSGTAHVGGGDPSPSSPSAVVAHTGKKAPTLPAFSPAFAP